MLMTQLLPSKEAEARSLAVVRTELDLLPESNPVYRSVGKAYGDDTTAMH